jgi:Pyridoxamine 5'-phosphate oxidase
MIWAEFEAAAPELAELGRERFERSGVALLGTLRRDGSPRISPVEPFFVSGHLLLGLLPASLKARDLRRDPRCVLHSVISAANAGESEFKLYGTVEAVDDLDVRESASGAWWLGRPADDAYVVSFRIGQAGFVAWNLDASEMTTLRWSPKSGTSRRTARYP